MQSVHAWSANLMVAAVYVAAALAGVRHLRGARVLLQDDGSELTAKVLRGWMKAAQRCRFKSGARW